MTKLALVLGGGGARGVAHVHVLEALDDLGIRPDIIAGASIGSIVGAGYASGMSGAEIGEYFVKTFSDPKQVAARMWQLRPDSIRSIFTETLPRFGELNAKKVMQAFLPSGLSDSFETLEIPLKIVATDFYGNQQVVIESGKLMPALAASAAIPVIFKAEVLNGTVLVDGGIVNPVPFDLVSALGHTVLAVDVVGMPVDKGVEIPSRISAGFGASQLLMQSITNLKLEHHRPDIFIRPEVSEFRVLDFLKAEQILERTKGTRVEVRTKLERLLNAS
ncbi:MAG: patatin-like phospholipase family protein [Rhizobiaceae bacterium]|nr:patatin-like phospholipase family protein [Rhizobiaceae bacterium]